MTWPTTQSGTDMDQPGLCQGGLAWISNKEEDLHSNEGRGEKESSHLCHVLVKKSLKYNCSVRIMHKDEPTPHRRFFFK